MAKKILRWQRRAGHDAAWPIAAVQPIYSLVDIRAAGIIKHIHRDFAIGNDVL